MRGRTMALVTLLAAGIMLWTMGHRRGLHAAESSAGSATQPSGVAVVELFTSQGCSSCPPAEKLLARIAQSAKGDGRPIFTLAFHVDYWNHLGWSDPFSKADYSQRQQDYSKSLQLKQVYTPQMIVNGRKEFIGSDGETADAAIAEAIGSPVQATITVKIDGSVADGCKVHAAVSGAATDALVNVAVVEQGLSTQVKSGENGGKKLDNPSVVRWFKTVPLSAAGEISIPPLNGVIPDHASVVIYVQKPANGMIIGAVASALK